MIKYIIEDVSSERDIYGNTYMFTRITSTKTKRGLCFDCQSGSGTHKIRELLKLEWSELYHTSATIPKRAWNEAYKCNRADKIFEHDLTASMITDLNKKEGAK